MTHFTSPEGEVPDADLLEVQNPPWQTFDIILRAVVEIPAAVIVVMEVIVLFSGIAARYAFHAPIVWTDELASTLFLWLAMFGAVIALWRAEHMRMTAVVGMASPRVQAFLEVIAIIAPLAFLVLILRPAYEYASEQAIITTSSMEISDAWRAAALPVGTVLMIIVSLVRLARTSANAWTLLGAVITVLVLVALFVALGPVFRTLGNLNLLVFFLGVVAVTVLTGVPIAFSFALATFGYLALTTRTPLSVMVGRMDEGMSHIILLAVPLFVFLGLLIEMTGMAKAMIRFLASLVGRVRGGLQYVLVGAMYLVSGISGAKAADMAAVAPALFPEMQKRGAKAGDLVALLAATGAQTETIPPSLVLIITGSVTGVSIAALFTGGLLPSLLLGIMLCLMVRFRYRNQDPSNVQPATRAEIGWSFVVALPALALPFLIRASVVGGVATATEVSTIGIVYSIIVGLLVYRQFEWGKVFPILVDTAALSGAILLIIAGATSMAWGLTQSGFSRALAAAMTGLPGGAASFLAVSIVAFVILGSVLEGIPAMVLFAPLLFPIARQVGVHEVHYAIVVIIAMGLGLFAPPFGVGYYAACAIARVHPNEGVRPIWGYLLALLIGLAVIAAVPWISIGFL
jgi:tripartite ATP-independent transporter DctM subunit